MAISAKNGGNGDKWLKMVENGGAAKAAEAVRCCARDHERVASEIALAASASRACPGGAGSLAAGGLRCRWHRHQTAASEWWQAMARGARRRGCAPILAPRPTVSRPEIRETRAQSVRTKSPEERVGAFTCAFSERLEGWQQARCALPPKARGLPRADRDAAHCAAPQGEMVWFDQNRSRASGRLPPATPSRASAACRGGARRAAPARRQPRWRTQRARRSSAARPRP